MSFTRRCETSLLSPRLSVCKIALLGTCLVIDWSMAPTAEGQTKTGKSKTAKKQTKQQAGALDPWERPEGSIVARTGEPKSARYYIWYDKQGWHLRTTANMPRQFSGTIKIEGGAIASCVSVGLKRDAKKQDDAWQVAGSRKELTFSFRTAAASDGFDFKLDGDAGEIEFDLSIDKEKRGQFVFVGNKQQHPGENPFRLPLAPKPPEKTSE